MGTFSFSILFLLFIFQSSITILHATKCSDNGPDISFPFQLEGQKPQYHHTFSGFELLCKNNITTIHFPSYGDLVVTSISYDTRRIDLHDPRNCAHEVFLNLNLSVTPFRHYYVLKNYTYLNCTTRLSNPFMEVPCLSGSSYHVYTVDPSLALPAAVSCKTIRTVAIPFEYSPYLSDNTLGLALTWDLLESEGTDSGNQKRDSCSIASNSVWAGIFLSIMSVGVFALAMMIKIIWSKRKCCKKEGLLLQTLTDHL